MLAKVVVLFGLVCIIGIQGSFIKPNNVPRVGRSNEADGLYDHMLGYVIKTIPSKNIPRMGRRNYDSENRYDIPKLYQLPIENYYGDEGQATNLNQEQSDDFFGAGPMEK